MNASLDMADSPCWLAQHRRDIYSQHGEDGVIAKILEFLPARDGWCVEFGAWDGRHLSNTRHLIEEASYSAVLIEGDRHRYEQLQASYRAIANVTAVNAFVGFTPDDGLDAILSRTDVPLDFDFLSIDIDGNDYHAWAATTRYRPKVVCVEFNSSISVEVDFVQVPDRHVNQGSSLKALVRLAHQKHYELASVVGGNAFFVQSEWFERFGIADNRPETLWTDRSRITYLFFGYDGTAHLAGCQRVPWHGIPIRPRHVQRLPRLLCRYPDEYGFVRKGAYYLWYLLTDPAAFMHRLNARVKERRASRTR